jgi:hypothetical protein
MSNTRKNSQVRKGAHPAFILSPYTASAQCYLSAAKLNRCHRSHRVLKAANQYLNEPITITDSSSPRSAGGA